MAVESQQERETTGVDALKEGALAEPHHALTCTTQILQKMFVCDGGICCLSRVFILGKAVSRQSQLLHHRNHLLRIKTAILVAWSGVELDGFGLSFREEVFASIAELQIFASCGFVGFGIVLFDESTCTAHQE